MAANSDYRACAQKIAGLITDQTAWNNYLYKPQPGEPPNFWRIANAFTTLIDYFVDAQTPNTAIGDSTLQVFTERFDPTDPAKWWYDDYGWWCVAFMQAAKYTSLVGHSAEVWQGHANDLWKAMLPATQVWQNRPKKRFDGAEPRFAGGCWNHDFVAGNCEPLEPGTWCGIQNTVTNTQYLVATARMGLDASAQTTWLNSWFEVAGEEGLLAWYDQDLVLIRERVSTFADGHTTPGYEPERAWAGDQGILLGALVEMARLEHDPAKQKYYYKLANAVLGAIPTKLSNAGILLPWTPADTIDPIFDKDYSTGIGVFMRYLLYVYEHDAILGPVIAAKYPNFITANANAVCTAVGKCPPLPDKSPMDSMECRLNQLAVLNAAVAILPD